LALFYLGAKGMCKAMFLHFVPVDGIEYFSEIFGWERYVFMFLYPQKTSLWTRPYFTYLQYQGNSAISKQLA
jgi:hypothetical protein